MNRRVSKREIRHRFDSIDIVRVHVDDVRSRSALVKIDGVQCQLKFVKQARGEMLRESGVLCYVESIPHAVGDGVQRSGTTSPDYSRKHKPNSSAMPVLKTPDEFTFNAEFALKRFEQGHPVGSIVSAKVRFATSKLAVLDLGQGQLARLEKGNCLDHEAGAVVKWLALPQQGACVDVFVRGFRRATGEVMVSLHSYQRDEKFCAFASGYRSSYNSKGACFEKYPWER